MVRLAQPGGARTRFSYVAEAVASSPELRADIETARRLGISLRRFHGWEPRRTTVRHPDGSWVTVTEPEFDGWERAIQAAYDAWRAGLCPDCGQPLSESLLDTSTPPAERPVYAAGFVQCRACEALELAIDKQAEVDRKRADQRTAPVPTHHRHWRVDRVDTSKEA